MAGPSGSLPGCIRREREEGDAAERAQDLLKAVGVAGRKMRRVAAPGEHPRAECRLPNGPPDVPPPAPVRACQVSRPRGTRRAWHASARGARRPRGKEGRA